MPNPTSRHSKARRDKRRANWKIQLPGVSVCPECREPRLPHRVCMSCGSYNGKKILEVVEKESV
ncbi:MAG: 50S ribosomal protein L32 [Nitrospiraceae bacterium]|nr:MAG: 50S ribosomal protein L32 [Nitrospiraceae bacterium]